MNPTEYIATYPSLSPQLKFGAAADVLAELNALKQSDLDDPDRPTRLSPKSIKQLPNLFQARGVNGVDPNHVDDLHRLLGTHGDLEPVVVWRCGADAILLDGHHRLRAYRRQAKNDDTVTIPVVWFEGSAKDALAEATDSHNELKLPLTPEQRGNHAWMLVCLRTFTKEEEARLSGQSQRTIANMRKAMKALITAEEELPLTWSEALAKSKAKVDKDIDWEEVDRQKAKQLADKMIKVFGTKLSDRADLLAMVLEIYCPRRIPELIRELKDITGDGDGLFDDEDEDEPSILF